jgi:hypothetical protein
MDTSGRNVDDDSSEEEYAQVRGAIERTIANVEGFDVRTVRARLENELASVGLHLHPDWVLDVAEPISRGETPPVPPLRFTTDG